MTEMETKQFIEYKDKATKFDLLVAFVEKNYNKPLTWGEFLEEFGRRFLDE